MVKFKPLWIFYTFFVLVVSLALVGARTQYLERQAAIVAEEAEIALQRALDTVDPVHLRCMATNIYWEAAAEPYMGKVAVARVVVNRINWGFGNNPCKVVYQAKYVPDTDNPATKKKVCQFSWVCEGKRTPERNGKYQQAEEIAAQVLALNMWKNEVPGNVLFFHANTVNPGWNYRKVMEIGNHVFYSNRKSSKKR